MLPAADKAALRREGSATGEEGEAAGGGEPPTGGAQPDMVVLEGWPETHRPTRGSSYTLGVARTGPQGGEGTHRGVSMHLGPTVRQDSQ
eukprot:2619297-Pyramimonas_sp.AAC.1